MKTLMCATCKMYKLKTIEKSDNSERLVGYDNSERLVGYDNSERLVGYDNPKKKLQAVFENIKTKREKKTGTKKEMTLRHQEPYLDKTKPTLKESVKDYKEKFFSKKKFFPKSK